MSTSADASRYTVVFEEELIDYEDEDDIATYGAGPSAAATSADDKGKHNLSGIHVTGFR